MSHRLTHVNIQLSIYAKSLIKHKYPPHQTAKTTMTQLTIDSKLLQEALKLSDETNADELIATALREYINHRKQLQTIIPVISDAEQQEIEAELGTPADIEAEEFVDLTEWTENAGQLQ